MGPSEALKGLSVRPNASQGRAAAPGARWRRCISSSGTSRHCGSPSALIAAPRSVSLLAHRNDGFAQQDPRLSTRRLSGCAWRRRRLGSGAGSSTGSAHHHSVKAPPQLRSLSQDTEIVQNDEETSTFEQALFNSVNILMGVGLLSVPYALKQGGWGALGVLALLGVATNYTGKLIIKCQESVCESDWTESDVGPSPRKCRPLSTYEDIGELAFGTAGRNFITFVLYTELLGTCGLFFILEGDHLQLLLGDSVGLDSTQLMLLSSLIILPTTWLPDLSALSYVGLLGGVAALTVTGVVTYEFLHGSGILDPAISMDMLKLARTHPIHIDHLPVTFGLLAFVFAGHAVFPGIYTSMKEKERFPEMLDLTYLIVGTTCLVIGTSGYLLYGDKAMEEVTMNLRAGLVADLTTCLILISPFTKFALTLDPVSKGVEKWLNMDTSGSSSGLFQGRLLRTGLGASTLVMAASLPFFAALMALIGSFLTIVVSVIFPSMCYLSVFDGKLDAKETALNYFVIALGIFCAAAGTYTAFNEIYSSM